jgi:CxxC motif-containing protein (DUF1111 family)
MRTLRKLPRSIFTALLLSATAAVAQGPQFKAQRPPKPPLPPPGSMQPPQTFVPVPATKVQLGDPLPGLTPDQLALFVAGMEEFENVETPEGGLGPIFNNVSCVSCHSAPATGGSSGIFVTRFGQRLDDYYNPLETKGGSLLQKFAIAPAVQEVVPEEANVIIRRQSTPLFGLGLVEAIPDAAILDNERRRKPDGVKGRAAMIVDVTTGLTRAGHFGWKAQQATLLAFAGDAYLNEMGITSRFFPVENAPNGNTELLAQYDNFADPEDEVDPVTGKGDIDFAADFIRFLAAPPRLPVTPSIRAGENVFQSVGCAICHVPVMKTGPNAVAALSNQPVALYSDLLLHDMGALGDGIAQSAASPREMKTPPLWGLRASAPYLHDGRASTPDAAIRAHDGEAAIARDRYQRLGALQRQQLLAFLDSL